MKIASVPNITPQEVIDNFVAVTVPAIKKWQIVHHPQELTKDELIGDLLLKLAESVSHISEVKNVAAAINVIIYFNIMIYM